MERVKMSERLPREVRAPHRRLFTLRVAPYRKGMGPTFTLTAYDARLCEPPYGHNYISFELLVRDVDGSDRRFAFDKWCGLPSGESLFGSYARHEVLCAAGMKPGDTESDYFAGYPQELLEIVEAHGDELTITAYNRYGEVDH